MGVKASVKYLFGCAPLDKLTGDTWSNIGVAGFDGDLGCLLLH